MVTMHAGAQESTGASIKADAAPPAGLRSLETGFSGEDAGEDLRYLFSGSSCKNGILAIVERNRYADMLRVVAIGGVVYGHWLLISVTYRNGQLSGLDALDYIRWGQWVTWIFQVMPVFFLVGGYVNARSWAARHADGQNWTRWVRDRCMRLWWPTAAFVVAAVVAVLAAEAAGVRGTELAEASWLVALQLWFLPVYMVLIALTPVMLAAHRRWGLAVPAVMAVAAGLVDAGVAGPHLHVIGYVNYLFVWGSIHQWGFAWQDATLTSPRWRPYAMGAGGAALLAGLLMAGSFKVDMVGSGNTNPPSIALLAYAAIQAGLVLAAEPIGSRLLARPRPWQRVRRLNPATMTVYLWHFVPVIVIAVAFYPTGVLPQPAIGTAEWWELRPAWWALLTVVLVPLVMAVMRAERPMLRLPAGAGPPGPWSPVLLVLGIAASVVGLARLAIGGFAPGGHLPVLVLIICAAGLVATLLTGRGPAAGTRPQAIGPEVRQQPPEGARPPPSGNPFPHIRYWSLLSRRCRAASGPTRSPLAAGDRGEVGGPACSVSRLVTACTISLPVVQIHVVRGTSGRPCPRPGSCRRRRIARRAGSP
jgi:fucose 4-O-acetylase-like acetyltransferase